MVLPRGQISSVNLANDLLLKPFHDLQLVVLGSGDCVKDVDVIGSMMESDAEWLPSCPGLRGSCLSIMTQNATFARHIMIASERSHFES